MQRWFFLHLIVLLPIASMSLTLENRLRGALWGLFAGDALAAPTHWYYGGQSQIVNDYGSLLSDYTKPKEILYGSIMNKSNTNGGGRGSFSKGPDGISIIGDVINHGKRQFWDPKKSVHYHATLLKGENTLEVQLVRVLMKSIVATGGVFDPDHFRQSYVTFMRSPGSHNDTYASTCHRMFFANLVFKNLPPEQCPDNDGHNVDTIDGLVLPTIAALAASANGDRDLAKTFAVQAAAVTRNSKVLESTSEVWSNIIFDVLHGEDVNVSLDSAARLLGFRSPLGNVRDEISACYLGGSLPPTLNMIKKYTSENNDVWTGILANANTGGENVHRGSILGAVLGAHAGIEKMPPKLFNLHHREELEGEINAFVNAVLQSDSKEL
mmetsp:Transcript_11958/g.17980  ORF Transcript_11958/g.17980 Transcript_11958/m.17980 type:complete len:381 (-) Transcript_11958:134-1276(-)